ncbi:MAG: hypothetical protein IKA00_12670 [Prevotella sp.]|nr:hypothetical protein [Prevotella sp.]
MEKKYIKPDIQVVEVELQPMMAASLEVKDDEVLSGDAKTYNPPIFDVWGLDEEE